MLVESPTWYAVVPSVPAAKLVAVDEPTHRDPVTAAGAIPAPPHATRTRFNSLDGVRAFGNANWCQKGAGLPAGASVCARFRFIPARRRGHPFALSLDGWCRGLRQEARNSTMCRIPSPAGSESHVQGGVRECGTFAAPAASRLLDHVLGMAARGVASCEARAERSPSAMRTPSHQLSGSNSVAWTADEGALSMSSGGGQATDSQSTGSPPSPHVISRDDRAPHTGR